MITWPKASAAADEAAGCIDEIEGQFCAIDLMAIGMIGRLAQSTRKGRAGRSAGIGAGLLRHDEKLTTYV